MRRGRGSDAATLSDYVQVLRRRRWLILAIVLFLTAEQVAFSLRQEPLYSASAEVLLSRQDLAASLIGVPGSGQSGRAPETLALTQANVASVPTVAARALRRVGLHDRTPQQLLDSSDVTVKGDTDLLVFTVRDHDARLAARLATAYARQFTAYRKELDTAALEKARRGVEQEIAQLEEKGKPNQTQYEDLVSTRQQIRTMEALQTGNTSVVSTSSDAQRVEPRPVRNGVIGLAIGLILGLVVAFVRDGLDTRVRRPDELDDVLDLPRLARIPPPPRSITRVRTFAMARDPNSSHAEAFRVLRTNLEFLEATRTRESGEQPAGGVGKSIMVTSAVAGEGKSTTVANLALAFARSGIRVIAVDLDLYKPSLAELFRLPSGPGLTDVALGYATLEEALVNVPITGDGSPGAENGNRGNGRADVTDVLKVLPAGPRPLVPAEFVGSRALAQVLFQLRHAADLIVVDAPALLAGSVATALTAHVDELLLVFRVKVLTFPALDEARHVLETSRARVLGYVVAGAELEDEIGSSRSAERSPFVRQQRDVARRTDELAVNGGRGGGVRNR
ncbi:MAG: P-loop NTPase [Actinomycetota bacterium]|nr:P-loop NTPase [Actinomycetota bacterium]